MALTASLISSLAKTTQTAVGVYATARAEATLPLALVLTMLARRGSRQDVYNVLWAVVFGFATLNILSLAARRFEPTRKGLSFGELLAVLVVLISIFLLGWELLNVFHVFPIKLKG